MILANLAKAIREQNYYAVVLEFLIVIAGVVIGFQITAWNEDRITSNREMVRLSRLKSDFDSITTRGEQFFPFTEQQPAATRRLIEIIRRDEDPELTPEVSDHVSKVNQVWVYLEASSTYEELVSTGQLSQITNTDLRELLNYYARAQEGDYLFSLSQYEFRKSVVLERAVQFSVEPSIFDAVYADNTYTAVSIDWSEMREIEPHLQVLLRDQMLRSSWHVESLDVARQIRALLIAELDNASSQELPE